MEEKLEQIEEKLEQIEENTNKIIEEIHSMKRDQDIITFVIIILLILWGILFVTTNIR